VTDTIKKVSLLTLLGAIYLGAIFSQRPTTAVDADAPITVTYTILNDNQIIEPTYLDDPATITSPAIVSRANVRLDGWYTNAELDEPFDFMNLVSMNTNLFARWDYLLDDEGKAELTLSTMGERFKSGTLELTFELYETLSADVTFQWQMKLTETGDWRDISGATGQNYRPLRNGEFGYRVVYRTPIYDGLGEVVARTRHETNAVWVTIYGEFPWVLVIVPASFVAIFMIVLFLSFKHPIHLYIDGQFYQQQRYRAQEDISDLSAPQKDGYRFDGWYLDEACTQKADLKRMPYRLIKRYGRYLKDE